MKRKVILLMLLGALLFLALPTIAAAAAQFADIQNHWAKDSILSLASKGFIDGYPDGTFQPDKPISRAEFTCILLNSMGITSSSSSATATFSDASTHWAHAQIAEAVQKGILIVSEYPKGLKPDDPILRSEAAAMMVRALGKQPDLTATTFKDSAQVAKSMYSGYIKTAYDEDLMHGYTDGTFLPYSGVKRGEACTMLSNLMQKAGSSAGTPAAPTSADTSSGGLTALVVQGIRYSLGSTPIYLRQNQTNVAIHSFGQASGLIFVNGTIPLVLNSASNNPDLVAGNVRFGSCKLSISGSDLQAVPTSVKLDSVTYNSYQYDSDYVKLYIGNKNSSYHLSDAELVDDHTLKIDNTAYSISNNQLSVALGNSFFAIKGISIGSGGASLSLTAIDPVVVNDLDLSDISIFVDNKSLDLDTVDSLFFIVDGTRYDLSDVTIDASGSFITHDQDYPPDQVTMAINDGFYQLKDAKSFSGRFVFYCTGSSATSWAQIDDKYRDASNVQIVIGGDTYSLDKVLVVKRNVIRIGGHQYSKSDNIGCRVDGVLYAIDEIDYDSDLDLVTIDTDTDTGALTGGVTSQPEKYVFYLNSAVYQDGAGSTDTIYAGGGWRSFDGITFTDQSHFTYNSTTYSLVNSKVQIGGIQFVITDSAWRISSQTLEIFLQKA